MLEQRTYGSMCWREHASMLWNIKETSVAGTEWAWDTKVDQLREVREGLIMQDHVCFVRLLAFTLNEMGRHCRVLSRGEYSLGLFCDYSGSSVKNIWIGLGRVRKVIGEWWKWKRAPVKKFCSNLNMAQVRQMPRKWEELVKFGVCVKHMHQDLETAGMHGVRRWYWGFC